MREGLGWSWRIRMRACGLEWRWKGGFEMKKGRRRWMERACMGEGLGAIGSGDVCISRRWVGGLGKVRGCGGDDTSWTMTSLSLRNRANSSTFFFLGRDHSLPSRRVCCSAPSSNSLFILSPSSCSLEETFPFPSSPSLLFFVLSTLRPSFLPSSHSLISAWTDSRYSPATSRRKDGVA